MGVIPFEIMTSLGSWSGLIEGWYPIGWSDDVPFLFSKVFFLSEGLMKLALAVCFSSLEDEELELLALAL